MLLPSPFCLFRYRPRASVAGGADWRLALGDGQRRRLRRWFWSIAAATVAVLIVGGITRLTQSGLSIVDWQPVMGVVPPLNDEQWTAAFDRYRQFPQYQLGPGISLSEFKAIFFWEYLHRLVARAIGLLVVIPFALFWRAGYLPRPLARRAAVLFALVVAQGVVGWLMVKSGLIDRPSVSHYRLALHLAIAFVILGYSTWLACDLGESTREKAKGRRANAPLAHEIRGLLLIGALLAAQVVWGAFVAGMKAGLFFNTFPSMGGQLLPTGLLGLDPAVSNLVQNPITVQWIHRVLGTMLLIACGGLFLSMRRSADRAARRLSAALLTVVGVQYLLGVVTLIYRVPVGLAVSHQAMAAILTGIWVVWLHGVVQSLRDSPSQMGVASGFIRKDAGGIQLAHRGTADRSRTQIP
jgi:cytochrome c oxidase assembly protein subunit 15